MSRYLLAASVLVSLLVFAADGRAEAGETHGEAPAYLSQPVYYHSAIVPPNWWGTSWSPCCPDGAVVGYGYYHLYPSWPPAIRPHRYGRFDIEYEYEDGELEIEIEGDGFEAEYEDGRWEIEYD